MKDFARSLALAAAFVLLGSVAWGASVPLVTGPQDVSQLNATLNTVINNINTILSPLTGGPVTGVNAISLVPGATGTPAQIALQPGADTNAGITINPNGSGNIVLFGPGDTGVLQISNSTSFVPANGLAACPGAAPGKPPFGMKGIVSGYFLIQDWLGRTQWSMSCG